METSKQNSTIRDEKSLLRKQILEKRASLPLETRKNADIAMAERIIGHQWFYRAEVILGFMNYDSEISTEEILKEALLRKKKLFLPKIEGNNMSFYKIDSLAELQKGYKGILEPAGNTEQFDYEKYKNSRLLILIPGVAFDIYGNRMGYGKGFYDRFLEQKEVLQTFSIGIGYKCQQVNRLPVDEHDIKPYQVILI